MRNSIIIPILTEEGPNAHIMTDARGNEFFFSYETCIAFRGTIAGRDGRVEIRLPNIWGPTTGRHMSALGCADFVLHSRPGFIAAIKGAC